MTKSILLLVFLILPVLALAGQCDWSSTPSNWYFRSDEHLDFGCTTPSCPGIIIEVHQNGEWMGGTQVNLTHHLCQTKEDLGTVVCPLIHLPSTCALHTAWGTRVTSCSDVKMLDIVFAVSPNNLFILPVIDERVEMQHVSIRNTYGEATPIYLSSVSERPRVTLMENIITREEAKHLRSIFRQQVAMAMGGNSEPRRDSMEVVEVTGDVIPAVRKRIYDLLGIFPYDDTLAEPMQILRLSSGSSLPIETKYDDYGPFGRSEKRAGYSYERFLTVLIPLQMPEAGGQIFMPNLSPWKSVGYLNSIEESVEQKQAKIDRLIHRWHLSDEYKVKDSPRQILLEGCHRRTDRNKFVKSERAVSIGHLNALIIYAQQGDGSEDELANFGICPVLNGTLYLARFHVLIGPHRFPSLYHSNAQNVRAVSATFESRDVWGAKLFWEDQIWEELVPGRPLKVTTFAGHRWHIRVELDEQPIQTWTILANSTSQRFVLTADDLPIYR